MIEISEFQVDRRNFSRTRFVQRSIPELQSGQVLLKVDRYAFTANNISYAVLGESYHYWSFFPTDEGWGIIPVWGFAEVVASEAEGIEPGNRYYGYFPMASHLVVAPARIKSHGFVDDRPHRRALPAIYNSYRAVERDRDPKEEGIEALFRPLFTTSFLINAFLESHQYFGAEQIIFTSASSKTAYGVTLLLAGHIPMDRLPPDVIGLTSAKNQDFVKEQGLFTEVFTYEETDQLAQVPSVIVDFSGNHSLQLRLQHKLGDALKYNCLVGLVHWTQLQGEEELPQKGTVFFAPTHYSDRVKEWGAEGLQQALGRAWQSLDRHLKSWISLSEQNGEAAIQQVYLDTLQGKSKPNLGVLLRP